MYSELYQYLTLYKKLTVPGIGTFQMERKPADIDFANRVVNPPAYTVALHHGQVQPAVSLYSWLAEAFEISERDAVIRFNDFAYELKEQVQQGKKLVWEGLGILSKGLAGEIRFEPSPREKLAGEPVPAVKVIRENAEHTMRVGEQEMTSSKMIELLNPVRRKRSRWWIAAVVLLLLAIAFIIWHFYKNSSGNSSAGNQRKLETKTEQPTYKVLP